MYTEDELRTALTYTFGIAMYDHNRDEMIAVQRNTSTMDDAIRKAVAICEMRDAVGYSPRMIENNWTFDVVDEFGRRCYSGKLALPQIAT